MIVCNDWHIPFHDKKLYKLFKLFVKDFKPEILVINGDFVDFWEISKFSKTPRAGKSLDAELREARIILQELRTLLPKTKIVYVFGNHEFRLRSYIINKAPELYGLRGLSVEEQLELKDLDIEVVAPRDGASRFIDTYYKLGKLYVGHFNQVNQHAGYTAKNLVERKNASILQAHTHRYGVSAKRTIDGQQIVGVENFCMCDLNPNYASDVNWQQGWSVVYLKEDSGRFHIYPIHVLGYAFLWDNKEYSI